MGFYLDFIKKNASTPLDLKTQKDPVKILTIT